ncbi:MAG: DUF4173 domain-containing protein [Dehalococcoidia bacterium]|nr:DUF4173 domain-containing protein [Dehalococcoidia bacterium]
MTERTKLGLGVLLAGLAVGIVGDGLLRVSPWGINILLWTVTIVLAAVIMVCSRGIQLLGEGRWLVLPALLFAAALAWRDSLTLGILNVLAVLLALALAASRARTGQLRIATILQYVLDPLLAGIHAVAGAALLVFKDIGWQDIPRSGFTRQSLAVVRGLIIGLPLIVCFGLLFMAADAVFQGMTEGVFRWLFTDVAGHVVLTLVLGWLVAGFLRFALIATYTVPTGNDGAGFKPLGLVEASIVLGMLNLLFLAFVLVQFRYFFGGSAMVEASTGLTYAEYARRGFFELVTVAALMLALLLAADWVVHRDNSIQRRVFALLVVALVGLLFVVMASAFQRMRLYQVEFGQTELRLYTTIFMGWIGVVFLWFLATVVRGRRSHFAFGMLVTGLLAVAFLNVMNPDEAIVRVNVDRSRSGQPLDGYYVASLSADAVPALLELLPDVPDKERRLIAVSLLGWREPSTSSDWRSWNIGRVGAASAVRASMDRLKVLAELP